MTFNEYIPLAIRTLNDLGSRRENLAHMGLGLGSEILEYQLIINGDKSDTVQAELGDLSWFTASTFHLLNIEYKYGSCHEEASLITLRYMAELIEGTISLIKKHFAYNVPIVDTDSWKGKLMLKWLKFRNKKHIPLYAMRINLHMIVQCIRHFSYHHGFDFELDILPGNIDKLKKRYPDGYSDYHAAERFDKKAVSESTNT